MARVPASKQTRKQLEQLFDGRGAAEGDRGELVKLAARLIVEEALEEEVEDVVGRGYYKHGDGAGGHRNGYRRGKLDSAEGRIEYAVPQVRGTVKPFQSAIREALGSRTEELERLAIEMYARGLSVRDIEAAFTDTRGNSLLSKSAVSQITERLWADYQAFAGRDLFEYRVLYLFIDGIAERLHLGQPREAVLAAWGITDRGEKVLLGLSPGTKEDTASARELLRDLKARGMNDPLLIVSDGAPGLIRAIEEVFPKSLRQRCLAHRMRNLQGKVPDERWREVKAQALATYTAASPMLARLAKEEFVKRFERELPSATGCFLDDFEACIAHLRLPIAHRRVIRTTNLLERLFGEERRRTKVIPHAFGERAVLKLMYAALIRASQTWRRVVISEFELKQIDELRDDLDKEFTEQTTVSKVQRASHERIYSKHGT
jgi:putative transposase